ncbi:hypothetical protein J8C02_00935 [Chloracidobacterium sp. MS 40/45]|jgi:hypothetical protein|uniref:hypothetical protein n=1 Tax=Chloracidobacterium aggregatum TaxID=2851959 RepID=UPI001B8D167A|nr:hypothetical protein [Chloracidobacterium aggregatum]QUW00119.1 hypothetical protein J8C02_00935 [Chloracidobacterium sp. MS 40/45]
MNKSKESETAKIFSDEEAVMIVGSKSVMKIGLDPEAYVAVFQLNSPAKANDEKEVVSVTKGNIVQREAPFGCSKIGPDRADFTLSDDAVQGAKSGDK